MGIATILVRMTRRFTVRLPEEVAEWLREWARETGMTVGGLVRKQLQRAKVEQELRPYMRFAGVIKGPRDLSTRKGFNSD